MSRRVIEHKDFSGGDWGRRQPWNAAPNTFSGLNMLVYRTGELGVRPGIRDVSPTDTVAGPVIALSPPAPTVADNVYFVQLVGGNYQLKRFLPTRGASTTTTLTNNFAGGSVDNFNGFVGSLLYIAAGAAGVYQASGTTLTKLNAVSAKGIVQYGDRLAINDYTNVNQNILRYNGLTAGVSDFTSWPATNIIPVGNRTEFSLFNVQKTHLSIGQPAGLYILTGALGVNESLRQAFAGTKGSGASDLTIPTVLDNQERIWYFNNPNLTPMYFDGASYSEFTDQRIPWTNANSGGLFWVGGIQPGIATYPVTDDDGVIYLCPGKQSFGADIYPARALIKYNGAWTYHEIPTNVTGQPLEGAIQSVKSLGLPDPGVSQTNIETPRATELLVDQFIMIGQTASAAPKFYSLMFGLDRPGYSYPFTGDGFSSNGRGYYDIEQAGDNSDAQVSGQFDLPEVHLKDADEFQVQGVIVDFRSWDTNGSLTNHFDVQVDCLRPYDNTSPITSLKGSWDEVGDRSSSAGTIKRRVFMFGEQGVGNGYQIKVTNARGVAFQRFQVILEVTKFRGV